VDGGEERMEITRSLSQSICVVDGLVGVGIDLLNRGKDESTEEENSVSAILNGILLCLDILRNECDAINRAVQGIKQEGFEEGFKSGRMAIQYHAMEAPKGSDTW
jgi:hypothetical protein